MNIKSVPFSRLGNKMTDIKYFKDFLPYDKINNVIEPFCGSFAVSRICYDPTKYKIYLNDNDINLINTINNINKYEEEVETIRQNITDKTITSATQLKEYMKNNNFIFSNELQKKFIVRGFLNANKTKGDFTKIKDFLKLCIITNNDYKLIMEEHKNNKNTFIFLDPPYFNSDNTYYQDYQNDTNDNKNIKDNTGMYIYMMEYIKNCKCKILLIINSNEILKYLYKDYIRGEYEKIYQVTKKKTKHLIITNYKL
jgi:site-specific DNA-adenine methylase